MQAPRPRSLLTKRCTTARRGGYVRKGLRPEVGGGPLWRVSNPFATQPSQPRQKASSRPLSRDTHSDWLWADGRRLWL